MGSADVERNWFTRIGEVLNSTANLRVSRRGAVGVLMVLAGVAGIERIINPALTDDQKQALERFNNTPREQRLPNLKVGKNPINLRNTPDTSYENGKGANKVGELEPGTIVSEAILVLGNDPNHPDQRRLTGDWYFIPSKLDVQGRAKSGAFAYSGNFDKQN